MIENRQPCGLAAAILADVNTAFAVVHYDCAVKNLSFPHEIGHLSGARHDLKEDKTIDPAYPWNHGYHIPKTMGRTIMAYQTAQHPNRLPLWSNPKVNYGMPPVAIGTEEHENNARMLNSVRRR